MRAVAKALGGEVLRDVSLDDLLHKISDVRKIGNDRAILRALHFFNENKRVEEQVEALLRNDFDEFKKLVIESGDSSWELCQNTYTCKNYREQGITLALAITKQILKDRGACRVHGGGFAGTIQAFVPSDLVTGYIEKMEDIFGSDTCYKLSIRPCGSIKVKI